MSKLTKKKIQKEFPELKGFKPNGKDDFDTVATIVGSRNPKLVWAIVNAFKKEEKKETSPAIQRLLAMLEE